MQSQSEKPIFQQIDDLHSIQVQFSGKTSSESETKKEEGWN
jgi:hypothetical protein